MKKKAPLTNATRSKHLRRKKSHPAKKKNCTIVEPKIKRNHQVTERIASTNQMVQGEGDASWFGGYREKI
jgi:hypothetical protein